MNEITVDKRYIKDHSKQGLSAMQVFFTKFPTLMGKLLYFITPFVNGKRFALDRHWLYFSSFEVYHLVYQNVFKKCIQDLKFCIDQNDYLNRSKNSPSKV